MKKFLFHDPKLLIYGFLIIFFASYGQTFFIALFNDDIKNFYSLTDGSLKVNWETPGEAYDPRSHFTLIRQPEPHVPNAKIVSFTKAPINPNKRISTGKYQEMALSLKSWYAVTPNNTI